MLQTDHVCWAFSASENAGQNLLYSEKGNGVE